MDLDELIERVGVPAFILGCELAWAADRRGASEELRGIQIDFTRELVYSANGNEVADELLPARLAVAEQLYRRMPGYAAQGRPLGPTSHAR